MKYLFLLFCIFLIIPFFCVAQEDSVHNRIVEYQNQLKQSEQIRIADSVKKAQLLQQFNLLKANERLEKAKLQAEFEKLEQKDSLRKAEMLLRVQSLKKNAAGYPVTLLSDTLFFIYTKIGASTPPERAASISKRIEKLYDDDFLKIDSLGTVDSEYTTDIVYGETIIMSLSELDALWNNKPKQVLAAEYTDIMKANILEAREENNITKIAMRIGLMLLVIAGIWLIIKLISQVHVRTVAYITGKGKWLKGLTYNDYTFLSGEQALSFVFVFLKLLKWFFVILALYLVLPIVFSIFPFTRGWATDLFGLVWYPFKGIFIAVWNYLPNLFSILVIIFVMRYFIRLVKYIFSEIEAEKLQISGFHTDWAMPTFSIVKFLLYAFMVVLIFPYLPGSDSNIFKGVSVFLGVLISLGSSSAIANMIAGLVITYMRPFKIGDRIKIGDMSGDVIEKTLLITRLRTIKNEEITIPNSAILSGNTINYSSGSNNEGLIVHTTVTIGYVCPGKKCIRR